MYIYTPPTPSPVGLSADASNLSTGVADTMLDAYAASPAHSTCPVPTCFVFRVYKSQRGKTWPILRA